MCKIWSEDRDILLEKLQACIKLNDEYQVNKVIFDEEICSFEETAINY